MEKLTSDPPRKSARQQERATAAAAVAAVAVGNAPAKRRVRKQRDEDGDGGDVDEIALMQSDDAAYHDNLLNPGDVKKFKGKLRPSTATYSGFGLLGTLGVSQLDNAAIKAELKDFNCGDVVDDPLLNQVLDAGINGWHVEQDGVRAVGLRKAVVDTFQQHALHWTWARQKISTTLFVALRRAFDILTDPTRDPDERMNLRDALQVVFSDGKTQLTLQNMLYQTGSMLNNWDCKREKKEKSAWMKEWRPFTVLLESAAKDIWQEFSEKSSAQADDDDAAAMDGVDCGAAAIAESGADCGVDAPKVFNVERDFPAFQHQMANLLGDASFLSSEAQRLHSYIKRDLQQGNGSLRTNLSPTFLQNQASQLQVAISRLVDSEHGKDLKALVRVTSQLVAAEQLEGKYVAQLVSQKTLAALVQEMSYEFFHYGNSGNGIGLIWKEQLELPSRTHGAQAPRASQTTRSGRVSQRTTSLNVVDSSIVATKVQLFKCGVMNEGEQVATTPAPSPPASSVDIEKLLDHVNAAPMPLLRGFRVKKLPKDVKNLATKARILLLSVSFEPATCEDLLNPRLSESTPAGHYLRRLLRPLWKHWRKVAVICSTPGWIDWWRSILRHGKSIYELTLVNNADGGKGEVPDTLWMLQLNDDRIKAKALHIWFETISRLVEGDIAEEDFEDSDDDSGDGEDDGDDDAPDVATRVKTTRFKMSLLQFYRKTAEPTFPLVVDEDDLVQLDNGVNADAARQELDSLERDVADFTRCFAAATAAPPDGFYELGQLMTTHTNEVAFKVKLWSLLKEPLDESWFGHASTAINNASTFQEVLAALPRNAPWAISRSVIAASGPRIVVNMGQVAPRFDGKDFFTKDRGSSKVVRLAMRVAKVSEQSCCCIEALPINFDFDKLGQCIPCREMVRHVVEQLRHVQGNVQPVEQVKRVEEVEQDDHVESNTFPEKSLSVPGCTSCTCAQRRNRIQWWISLHFLAQMRIASIRTQESVLLVPWGATARKVVATALDPRWRSQWWTKINMPNKEVSHPNAPFFSTSVAQVGHHVNSVVAVVKTLDDSFRDNKRLKSLLKLALSSYDQHRFHQRQVGSIQQVRQLVRQRLEGLCRKVNLTNERDGGGSLQPVNLQIRVNRLMLSLALQTEACNASFLNRLDRIPRGSVCFRPSKSAPSPQHATKLGKGARKSFLRRCYQEAVAAAHLSLHLLKGPKKHRWKGQLAKEFQAIVAEVLKQMPPDEAFTFTQTYTPQQLFAVASRNGCTLLLNLPALEGSLDRVRVRKPPAGHWYIRRPDGFMFIPQQPLVKLVPDVSHTIGHIQVTKEVGCELLVRALRVVADPKNLALFGGDSNLTTSVLKAAMKASFHLQRNHFKSVKGSEKDLNTFLDEAFNMACKPQTVATGDHNFAAMLSLFDWARVVYKNHKGTLYATTDGVGLNMAYMGSSVKGKKKKKKKSNNADDVWAYAGSDEVAVVGVDYGKSGAVAVMPPSRVQQHLHVKAKADAAAAATGGEKPVHSVSCVVTSLDTDRNKGVQCVSKAQKAVELHEQQHREERVRRLAVFDRCLASGITHHKLQSQVVSIHKVVIGAEVGAVVSTLKVKRLLQIAHCSGSVRQQRRSSDKLMRGYVARYTRVVTKVLPEAVAASGEQFLQNNVVFPSRGPQSRSRERVRGWERGTHLPQLAVQHHHGEKPSPWSSPPPLKVSCDLFTSKGQRTTSTFPFTSLHQRMCRLVKSCPLAERVLVQIENGHRSSRQAAGLRTYMTDGNKVDHRSVKATDAKVAWHRNTVDNFKWFFCPVTQKIVRRDPPAALNMVVVGTCSLHGAPRPSIFCP